MNIDVAKKLFSGFLEEYLKDRPESKKRFDSIQSEEGKMSFLSEIIEEIYSHSDVQESFLNLLQTSLSEDEIEETSVSRVTSENSFLYEKETGLPQLNPFLQSAIAERVQFDGDIPEIRQGVFPLNTNPAVSVVTEAKTPWQIGEMLERASRQMLTKLKEHQILLAENLREELTSQKEGLLVYDDRTEKILKRYEDPKLDLPEYRRGEVPAPVKVRETSSKSLLAMSDADKKRYTWKSISTTQGRRSYAFSLEKSLAKKLATLCSDITLLQGGEPTKEPPDFEKEVWVSIGGENSMNPLFSWGEHIESVMYANVKNAFLKMHPQSPTLEAPQKIVIQVTEMSRLAERLVGWKLMLWYIKEI